MVQGAAKYLTAVYVSLELPGCFQLGSAFMSTCVRSEKSHTGKEKEHPTEQTHHVPVPDARYYKE
jgi:hypothetical protein